MSTAAALERALQMKRAGSLDEAVIALEGVLERAPDHPLALAHLAHAHLRRGRLEEAGSVLDRAEAAAGTTPFTARLRGDLSYRQDRWLEASRAYQDADALGDRDTWTLVQLARCRMRLRDTDGARGAASRALERDEAAAPAWTLLGDLAKDDGDLDEAEAMYQRAHEHDADDQFAYARLVEVRLMRLPLEQRDREVEVLLKSSGKGNRHLMGVLARVRSQQGDDGKAADTWKQAAESAGGDPFARKMHGYALRKAGRLDEAATVMRACLLDEPEDVILFRTYIHLQRQRGALDELRQTLTDLVPRSGNRKGAVLGELRKLGTR